ncbi:hypothetical protein B0H14DRAFT_2784215 [Mycena olivaceomarginata]|nr:hypothetical protein B0H14DRAFT_2784215 [Mycena olivaceomarginata]
MAQEELLEHTNMFFTQLLTVLYMFHSRTRQSPVRKLDGGFTFSKPRPHRPSGNVAAAQITTGDTRIYYQDSTGAIVQGVITAPFLSGGKATAPAGVLHIPASEVLLYTPIVAITANTATYTGIRVYFLSPEHVLSEYIWAPATGFIGGPSCIKCLTTQGIKVQNGSNVLYAMANTAFNQFRVGFVREAENLGGGWGVAAYT